MGSFIGHALPGVFFVIFGTWFLIGNLRHYFKNFVHRHSVKSYQSQITFSTIVCGGRQVNLIAWVVLFCTVLGIIVEVLIAPAFRHTSQVGYTNTQHATMYFFFGLVGLLALACNKLKMFTESDSVGHVSLAMAYAVEGALFLHHLGGRNTFDVSIHTWLVYSVGGCVAFTILEIWNRESLLLCLGRCFFTILQGTWFIQAGFLLYNPIKHPWSLEAKQIKVVNVTIADSEAPMMEHAEAHDVDHESLMKVAVIFCWHVAVLYVLLLVLLALFQRRYQDKHFTNVTSNGNREDSVLQLLDETEDEH